MTDLLLLSRVASSAFDLGQEVSGDTFQRLCRTPGTTPLAPTQSEVQLKHLPGAERTRAQLLFMFRIGNYFACSFS